MFVIFYVNNDPKFDDFDKFIDINGKLFLAC